MILNKSITFLTLLYSSAPCKISKNTLGPKNIIRTILLVFPENKIRTQSIWIFCVFLWCQGSLLTVIRPHISCNAIAGVVWTVNNDHDTTNTPKNYLKNLIFEKKSIPYFKIRKNTKILTMQFGNNNLDKCIFEKKK